MNFVKKTTPWFLTSAVALGGFFVLAVIDSAKRTIKRINSDYSRRPHE